MKQVNEIKSGGTLEEQIVRGVSMALAKYLVDFKQIRQDPANCGFQVSADFELPDHNFIFRVSFDAHQLDHEQSLSACSDANDAEEAEFARESEIEWKM